MPVQAAAPASRPAGGEDIRQKIAVGVFVAIGTIIVIAQWVLSAWSSPQIGFDFPVFYIAGHLPLHLLYSRAAFAAFWQEHLAPLGVPHWAPYVRPSIFSFLLRPMAALPYFPALWLWLGAGLSAYFAAVGLLLRKFRLPGFLLPIYAGFFPAIVGIIGGADASFFLLALVLAWILLERKRDGLAALALTMCLCKFNLILLIPVMLLLHRRYRALVSFAMGGVLIAAASMALTPVRDYVTAVADAQSKTAGFFPVGLRGFSTAIGQPWCYPVLAAAVFVLCCWLMKRLPMTEAFCVAITGALLVSPYVTWYDSTLLALPIAVVFARSAMAMRVACVAVLVAVPLWRHGGGNNGPIGFMHVGVELLILAYFVHAAGVRLRTRGLEHTRGKRHPDPGEPPTATQNAFYNSTTPWATSFSISSENQPEYENLRNRSSLWVVVPAHNEARSIGEVVTSLRFEGYQVVVVDDGSRDATADMARRTGATVLHHCQNLGQGGALQTGIAFSLRSDAQFICTFDADGQHCAGDIQRMWNCLISQDLDVVLGSRFLGNSPGISLSRKLLLKMAVLFTRFHSGLKLTDAHNGLRVMRAEAASKLGLRQLGMAHASEIVDRIAHLKLRCCEFPVTVLYTQYSKAKGQSGSDSIRVIMDLIIGRMMR